MRHINKIISLEPFYSRKNWIIPSYDNTDVNEDGSVKLISNFSGDTCNYGLIPLDIKAKNNSRITYRTMMDMYFWMKKYIELLRRKKCHVCENLSISELETIGNDTICKELLYDSAVDFYNHEKYHLISENEQYYKNLDITYNKYSELIGGKNFDEKSKKFEFENFVENLDLEIFENVDYSLIDNTDSELDNYPNCIDIPLIMLTSIDDMGEYSIFYNEWENGKVYKNKGDIVFYDDKIYKKTENYGEFNYGSIYSKRYRESYFANISELTEYDKEWYDNTIKRSGNKATEGNDNQWDDITNDYFSNSENVAATDDNYDYIKNKKKVEITEDGKTIDQFKYVVKNGRIIFNPTNDINNKKHFIGDKYEIINNGELGMFYIDNDFYNVFENKYVSYNGIKYLVHKFDATNMDIMYCSINGVKYYSEYTKDDKGEHKNKIKINKNNYLDIKNGYFISYKDLPLYISDNKEEDSLNIELNGKTYIYNKIYGYVNINETIYKIYNNKIIDIVEYNDSNDKILYNIIDYESDLGELLDENPELNEKGYFIKENILYVFKPKTIYNSNGIITGYTDSKLTSLYTKPFASDNIGNQMPCAFQKNEDGNILQPSMSSDDEIFLAFSVKKGNVSHLTEINNLFVDDKNKNKSVYWGNIVTDIVLYYLDNDGVKHLEEDNEINDTNIINRIKKIIKYYENNNNIIKTLYCDITYYIGAIISLDVDKNEYKYEKNGVKCIDTVYLTKETEKFYINDYRTCIVNYFKLNYPKEITTFNEYNNTEVITQKCYFEIDTCENNEYRDISNGMISAPIFREEYKFGSSSLEKVESDIYIDRGISNSFEKHLKLLEINSLDSLVKYGNGFYNIIKN